MAALSTEAITMPEAMRRSFDSTPNSKNLVRSSEKVYEDGINRINRINPMHLSSDVQNVGRLMPRHDWMILDDTG